MLSQTVSQPREPWRGNCPCSQPPLPLRLRVLVPFQSFPRSFYYSSIRFSSDFRPLSRSSSPPIPIVSMFQRKARPRRHAREQRMLRSAEIQSRALYPCTEFLEIELYATIVKVALIRIFARLRTEIRDQRPPIPSKTVSTLG